MRGADAFEPFLGKDLGPKRFAGLPPQNILFLRKRGELYDTPIVARFLSLFKNASREVVPVPARLDHDDKSARSQARRCYALPPIPLFFAETRTARLFVVFDGVINDQQVRALACDGAANTRSRHT